MTDHTHQTAPTQFLDGAGIRFAYRRFGKNQGVPSPKHVRRLVLVGTGPHSGEGMATLTADAKAIFGKTYAVPDELRPADKRFADLLRQPNGIRLKGSY